MYFLPDRIGSKANSFHLDTINKNSEVTRLIQIMCLYL